MPDARNPIHGRHQRPASHESQPSRVTRPFALLYIAPSPEGVMADVSWRMKGQYIKNCNCVATCPCDTTGFPYPEKGCQGMAGMHVVEGSFGNVKLDGLSWVVTYSWPGALHEGNGTVQPFVDAKATEEQ